MEQKYNVRNPAVKRLMREARELLEATEEYCAKPLDDNLFEWHFTVHGSPGTDYEGGVYHGRILLPPEYPMKPPNIILLTPNGRFETNKKICLSISGHHPETWQPSWSIRTALLALIAFMSSPGNGAIGSLDYTPEERKFLAKKSQNWSCPECGKILSLLSSSNSKPMTEEETNIISQIALKAEENLSTKNSDSNNIVDDISELVSDVNNRDEASDCNNFSCNTAMASDRNISVTDTNDQTTLVNETQLFSDILLWSIVGIIILLILRRLFFV